MPFNWFDILLLIVLLWGVKTGQKRGMSESLLPMIKWMAIVAACGFGYQIFADMMTGTFSMLASRIMGYLGILIIIWVFFAFIKRAAGGKLAGSDAFKGSEYYLGMIAGLIQFACATVVALAILNVFYTSPKDAKANKAMQMDVYGSDFFPTLHTIQESVFEKSLTGPFIKKNLEFLLIEPTPHGAGGKLKRRELDLP